MTLGERLTELRKKEKLSQEEVAEKLNVTRQTVSKWELDQSTPDIDKVVPICKLYNISCEELLTGKKIENPNNDMNYNMMTDQEISKKSAIAICQSIIIFIIAIGWILIADSLNFISEEILVAVFLLICGVGIVNIIYKLSCLPKKESTIKRKERHKKTHKYDGIISIVFTIIYLLVSFVTGAWAITWIIWIIFALVCEIVHIALGEEEDDD